MKTKIILVIALSLAGANSLNASFFSTFVKSTTKATVETGIAGYAFILASQMGQQLYDSAKKVYKKGYISRNRAKYMSQYIFGLAAFGLLGYKAGVACFNDLKQIVG